MAISWLTVLQAVPWGDVINNAPKVADGAKKLWGSVSGKPGAAPAPAAEPVPPTEPVSLADLQARLAATDARVAQLHEQMVASSEIIQALAEQNTQLIQRVETHRVVVRRLAMTTALLAVVAVAGLALALWR